MNEKVERYNISMTEKENKKVNTLLQIIRQETVGLTTSSWEQRVSDDMLLTLLKMKEPQRVRLFSKDNVCKDLLNTKLDLGDTYEEILHGYYSHCTEKGLKFSLGLERFLKEDKFKDYAQDMRGVL